ncbi:MAG TPA: serine/threonine-protein kinase, partial [Blastocatellia bacterium]|nr:serine/threonine-protein kinase [Blastocatellia bacterium]
MESERWRRIESLYYAALERDAAERAAFLIEECAGDDDLRREVESLLAVHEQAEGFMAEPALEIAAQVIAEDQSQTMSGRKINHYQVLSLLGAGGMGEVYLAEDTRLGRKVALKLLPQRFTQDRERVLRFQQEARAASALNHPNILTIYEIGEFEGRHFIATEFIDGQTLRELMNVQIKLRAALDVATQVASALSAAHEAGIVHRDIKPENIMARRDGYVKVLDFGLAKLTERFSPGQTASADNDASAEGLDPDWGRLRGTLRYMSPEQIRGLEVDGRSDVFSLGVVLHEMVTGRAPFDGTTFAEVMIAILNQEPSPLRRYARDAPAELERIVYKALQKDCEERYQVIKDLWLDLKSLKLEL